MAPGELTRRVRGWAVRYRARRRARVAAIRRSDEFLADQAFQARDSGAPYDTWRQWLPMPRRGAF